MFTFNSQNDKYIYQGKKMEESKRRDSNASDKSEDGDQKLTNQFSFVERATQTMNNALKVNRHTEHVSQLFQNLMKSQTLCQPCTMHLNFTQLFKNRGIAKYIYQMLFYPRTHGHCPQEIQIYDRKYS